MTKPLPRQVTACIPSDHSRQITGRTYIDQLVDPGRRVTFMDLGCGDGRDYDRVAKKFKDFDWYGVDIAESGQVSLRNRDDVNFVTFDGINLPFEDNTFDYILSRQVYEHVRHPDALTREVSRVLKPGGKFFGSFAQLEPYHGNSIFNITYYGFFLVTQDSGLHLKELRPGVDAFTILARHFLRVFRKDQRLGWIGRYMKSESPVNEFFASLYPPEAHKRINAVKLRYAGHVCFLAEKPQTTSAAAS